MTKSKSGHPQVPSRTFFILHEEIVKKADYELKEVGGLDRRSDQSFYGHGEGEKSSRSINYVMKKYLIHERFKFEGFYKDPEGDPKFNIDYLRKQKAVYNKKAKSDSFESSTVEVKQHYLSAFLFFLKIETLSDLEKKHSKYEIKRTISHTHSSKKETSKETKPVRFFYEDRFIDAGYVEAIRNKLANTEWYLYTYNFDHNKIVKAALEFKDIGDEQNYVNLVNAGSGYNYIGNANFRLAPHRIIAFDLVSRLVPAKHFHLKFYVNFGRIEDVIMLGKQIGFGHSFKIITSSAILIKMDQEEESPLGIGFYDLNHPDLHPAIVKFLCPKKVEYSVIPWYTFFDLEHLSSWLEEPGKDQPLHFKPGDC